MSTETRELNTRQAVKYLLDNNLVTSKYALAQILGMQPIMIDNYLKKGTRMGELPSEIMHIAFNIIITDTYRKRHDPMA